MELLDNFVFGTIANTNSAALILLQLAKLEFFWGLTFGFIIATSAQAWLISDDPKHIPTILMKDRSTSFKMLYSSGLRKGYTRSFSTYVKTVDKVHFAFSLSIILFLAVLLVGMLQF